VGGKVLSWVGLAAGVGWIVLVVATVVSASLAVLSLESSQRHLRRQQRRSDRHRSRTS